MPEPRQASRRGRPPKLSRRMIGEVAAALRAGNFVVTTCALVGIHRATFYEWMHLATLPGASRLLREFSDTTRRAIAEAEARDVAAIDAAAQKGSWQAAAWRLERRVPQRWCPSAVEVIVKERRLMFERLWAEFIESPELMHRVFKAAAGQGLTLKEGAAVIRDADDGPPDAVW